MKTILALVGLATVIFAIGTHTKPVPGRESCYRVGNRLELCLGRDEAAW